MKILPAIALLVAVCGATNTHAQEKITWLHLTSIPEALTLMEDAAAQYEAANPGVDVEMQFLGPEAYKAKLTTLLQSNSPPAIIHSWGGGVLDEQYSAGVLRDIDTVVGEDVRRNIGEAGVNAFTRDGKMIGLATNVSEVVVWYNKKLFEKAGLDPDTMGTWDGFLAGVKTLKEAGITPIALGGKDKWPAHFYWSYLVVRLAGQAGFEAARADEGDGFASPEFVKAGELFLELAALEPFQEGYLAATYGDASGFFGDGKAAIHLMGDWDYATARSNSASKVGIPDVDLGIMRFPAIEGGRGDPTDTLGGLNGWIFSKSASDEAVKFMEYFDSVAVQTKFASGGFYIPLVAGASEGLANPFQQQISKNIQVSKWHAIFFDQALGPNVGGVVNDVSVELAARNMSAAEAAEAVAAAVADSK